MSSPLSPSLDTVPPSSIFPQPPHRRMPAPIGVPPLPEHILTTYPLPQEPPFPRSRIPQRPRLASHPALRGFFHALTENTAHRQTTFAPAAHQDALLDVNRALQSANRAVQSAQEAFHQARRSIFQSEAQPVDLTRSSNSPEDSHTTTDRRHNIAEDHFISQTTHPDDPSSSTTRPRRLHSLDEPVYGAENPAVNDDSGLPWFPRSWPPPPPPRPPFTFAVRDSNRLQQLADEEAILTQRDNHSFWRETQARTRERLRTAETRQPLPRPTTPPIMSPPASSSSSRRRSGRPRRQHSISVVEDPSIESVDLTAVDDSTSLSAALAKQRQDAILAQNQGTDAGRTPLTAYKCPVCMDIPTDATSTVCGHVFCHRCIIDTLNWSIQQRREDAPHPATRKIKGVCPVCRKQLDLKDVPGAGRHLVPLELKLMVKKRKRDSDDKGKQKQRPNKADLRSDDSADSDYGENVRAGKAPKRETTDEALWGEFIND